MEKLKRKLKKKTRVYNIYTQKEADEAGLDYSHWKQSKMGDYALSDDGFVGKCIGRKDYTDKKGRVKTFVRLAYGANWAGRSTESILRQTRKLITGLCVKLIRPVLRTL
jgi:hypothetical protein